MFLFSSSPLSLEDVLKATKRPCMGSAPGAKQALRAEIINRTSIVYNSVCPSLTPTRICFSGSEKFFAVFSVNLTPLAAKSFSVFLTLLAALFLWTQSPPLVLSPQGPNLSGPLEAMPLERAMRSLRVSSPDLTAYLNLMNFPQSIWAQNPCHTGGSLAALSP